jgi:hypothetical protein
MSLPAVVGNHTDSPPSFSTDPASCRNDNLLSIPAPESTSSNSDNSDKDFGNSHFALNKAMGVDPTDCVAVQARRKSVTGFCLDYNKTLDKPYQEWTPTS